MDLVKIYNAGVASGRFTKKGQQEQRFATPTSLGPAPAPDAVSSSPQESEGSSSVSCKNVRDAGIVIVQGHKRQN